jgi:hypothetical protein
MTEPFVSSDGTLRSYAAGNVLVNLYFEANSGALAELHAHQTRHCEEHERIAVLSVVLGTALEFDGGGRETANRLVTDFAPVTLANATVILAGGIRGAIARSMVAAIFLARPVPHPRKVFSSVEEASDWLVSIDSSLGAHREQWLQHVADNREPPASA